MQPRELVVMDDGADAVVSIHLSRELSGTWEAAVLAAQEVGPDRVGKWLGRSLAGLLPWLILSNETYGYFSTHWEGPLKLYIGKPEAEVPSGADGEVPGQARPVDRAGR